MFVCLDVCVYFLRVFTAKMPYTQTPKTHTHLYLGGSKLTLIYDFFILNVNSRLICEFKRSTVKQTRKMHMYVCVYGPFWRSARHKKCRNAPYTHTHIHTHFCFLFSRPQTMLYASLYLGKSALFTREECTFGTWLGHPKMLYTSLDFGKSASLCVNNALLGNFGGHKTSFKPKTT